MKAKGESDSDSELQCWAQSVDQRYPWICLRNLWIHSLRRNPWIAQISVDRATRSMNFAYDTILLAQTYMDGLVISTNLKLNHFTHFNGPLQSTEQNHRPSASESLHGRRSRQVPAEYYYYYALPLRTGLIRGE